ncbi:MAG: protein kinase [Gemmatimonadota bacterium]|nr:MAG: protein kinase [Gemmatimonadota bacterium]
MIGETISHYKILEKLGEGGMGVVYKAQDTKLDRTVALKFLPPELTRDPEAKERFVQEAKAAAALKQHNICTIHEINETRDGQTFIAMDCYEGLTLKGKIESGSLKLEEAVDIAMQVAQGLTKAHEQEIVHRDIKPANIILDEDGVAKILDFGLAKLKGQARITRTGTTVGTVAYMSPEQAQGIDVDHRTDIWSLGVVLYEMLTGKTPFSGEHEAAIMYSIINEEPEPIQKYRSDLSSELLHVLSRALEKNPEERYQSVNDMLIDLKRLKRDTDRVSRESISEMTVPSRPESVKGPRLSKRLWIAGIGVVAVLAIVLAVWRTWFDREAEPAQPRVVVSVFENRTGDSSLDALGSMAMDWITQGLAQSGVADVVPTVSVMQYARTYDSAEGKPLIQTLILQTGATIAVSGAYYVHGDNLQFQAEVTDALRDELIHTIPPVIGSRENPIAGIDELRQRVMGVVAGHIDPSFQLRMLSEPPSFDVYREYVTGTDLFGTDYPRAIGHFERAAELDSMFMPARMRIAVAYGNQGQWARADSICRFINRHRERLSPFMRLYLDWYRAVIRGNDAEAYRFIRQAGEMAPNDWVTNYLIGFFARNVNRPGETVEVYSQIDYVRTGHIVGSWRFGVLCEAHHMLGDYERELQEARRGQEYFPDLLSLREDEVRALAGLGRIEEINKVIDESLSISSSSSSWSPGLVMCGAAAELRVRGYKEEAKAIAERAVAWYQNRGTGDNRYSLARSLYLAERWQEAEAIFEGLSAEEPDDIDYMGFLGTLAARRGNREGARQISEELKRIERPYLYGDHTYWRACIAALLGEREQAVALLRESFAQGYNYGVLLHNDMDLEPLRDYRPFQELIRPKG